ncbi:MAG: DUF512 domain-containing protein [Clostridia bacterium]|nr:DUF512 domain-containing protein [Clostridia bacterium]
MADFRGMIIQEVAPGSLGEGLGLMSGDRLISINGKPIKDLIDYKLHITEEFVEMLVQKDDGSFATYQIDKEYDQDLGLAFREMTSDGIKQCRNRCLFCFVDQMPPGMRKSLYVKDDDYRHSFLAGNFISLTNLDRKDLDRIISLRLSPLYVSVHTTDPDLRIVLMGNKKAGGILQQLQFLTEQGIVIHAQIVLCPGINDGGRLEKTIQDLAALWPQVQSVAVVPVGLTKYRAGLPKLRRATGAEASQILQIIEGFQQKYLATFGSRFVFPADEFYLLAEKELPSGDAYEEYPQLENGVGIVRLFLDEYTSFRRTLPDRHPQSLAENFLLGTGKSAVRFLEMIADDLNRLLGSNRLKIVPIENHFFGPDVTVTGLITGKDLIDGLQPLLALKGKKPTVLLSEIMFNADGMTLDNLTVEEIEYQLKTPIKVLPNSGSSLAGYILGLEKSR